MLATIGLRPCQMREVNGTFFDSLSSHQPITPLTEEYAHHLVRAKLWYDFKHGSTKADTPVATGTEEAAASDAPHCAAPAGEKPQEDVDMSSAMPANAGGKGLEGEGTIDTASPGGCPRCGE